MSEGRISVILVLFAWLPTLSTPRAFGAGGPADQGVELFERRDFAASLVMLTRALEADPPPRQEARVRLYIGLIQAEFEQTVDARASFSRALELDPRLTLPARASAATRELFESLRPKPKVAPARRDSRPARASRKSGRTAVSPIPALPEALEVGSSTTAWVTQPVWLDGEDDPTRAPRQDSRTGLVIWVVSVTSAAVLMSATFGVLSLVHAASSRERAFAADAEDDYRTAVDERQLALAGLGVAVIGISATVAGLIFDRGPCD